MLYLWIHLHQQAVSLPPILVSGIQLDTAHC